MSMIPSGLNEVELSPNPAPLVEQNFALINEYLFQRKPTLNTAIVGPPTSGAHVLHERWIDALRSEWTCVTAGTPGTWVQLTPAVVTSDPTAPNGYRIVRSDSDYAPKLRVGGVWVAMAGQRWIAPVAGADQAVVTPGNANGAISGLTFSASPTQAECQALRDACETLADDCRAAITLVNALRSAGITLAHITGAA